MRRRRIYSNGISSLRSDQELKFSIQDFWKAKHSKDYLAVQDIKIRCQGGFHKIRLRFPGHITLLNHDQRQERLMMKLEVEGKEPECLRFLKYWKEYPGQCCVGRPLVQKFQWARQQSSSQRLSNDRQYEDHIAKSLEDRLRQRLDSIFRQLSTAISKLAGTGRNRYNYSNPEEDYLIEPIIQFKYRKGKLAEEEGVGESIE